MEPIPWLSEIHHYVLLAIPFLLAAIGSSHALLYKRDSRAAALWVAFIWFAPVIGVTLYFIFGVNRIKRQAVLLRGNLKHANADLSAGSCSLDQLATLLSPEVRHLTSLASAANSLAARPLLPGNRVELLINGDAAFPAMLDAIASARETLTLSTYIFDRDEVGLTFARALGDAVRRGVEVRILIDATGSRYSWPTIAGALRREGIRYARFLSAFPVWQLLSFNLRNHRKIMVVDGRVGFTGGMNLRQGHWLAKNPARPVRDLHFRVEGPIVRHLQEVFVDDWFFTTREALRGERWFPPLENRG